jgi:hypothetical protein
MHGIVTSYNSNNGYLVVNVTNAFGSGTYSSWNVALSGPIALTGINASVAEINKLVGLTAVASELNLLESTTLCANELNNRFINLGIAASVGSNALTVSLNGTDGNNPSSTNIVTIPFRSATITSVPQSLGECHLPCP